MPQSGPELQFSPFWVPMSFDRDETQAQHKDSQWPTVQFSP